jgi:ABC-2 type transport system ATP-binding protein
MTVHELRLDGGSAAPPEADAAVAMRGVSLGRVLRDVNFAIPEGACLGVIGLNGAGKSTLVAVLAGVLSPDQGEVSCPSGAYLPEGFQADPSIRVVHWLRLARHLPGWQPEVGDALAAELAVPRWQQLGALSQGQRVRLGLVLTLGRRVPVYLLDDPFLGLDPVAHAAAERWIARRSEEATVVMAAQDADAVERLCTHLLLLQDGAVRGFDEMDNWRRRYRAVRVVGGRNAVLAVAARVLHQRERAGCLELVLDDADGLASRILRTAGAEIEPVPMRLDELIGAVVGGSAA